MLEQRYWRAGQAGPLLLQDGVVSRPIPGQSVPIDAMHSEHWHQLTTTPPHEICYSPEAEVCARRYRRESLDA